MNACDIINKIVKYVREIDKSDELVIILQSCMNYKDLTIAILTPKCIIRFQRLFEVIVLHNSVYDCLTQTRKK